MGKYCDSVTMYKFKLQKRRDVWDEQKRGEMYGMNRKEERYMR